MYDCSHETTTATVSRIITTPASRVAGFSMPRIGLLRPKLALGMITVLATIAEIVDKSILPVFPDSDLFIFLNDANASNFSEVIQ